jgi:hypothetical protein
MFPFNLGRLGNGITWWLGISPYELFFYIFLPPLLCDSAVRIDFFLFKQVQLKLLHTHWMLAHVAPHSLREHLVMMLPFYRWQHP